MTIGKSQRELLALLNYELSKHEVCDGLYADHIERLWAVDEHRPNWDVSYLLSDPNMSFDCKRAVIAVKYNLQQQFHLLCD